MNVNISDVTGRMTEILSRIHDYRRSGSGWVGRCPCGENHANNDNDYSLSLNYGHDGKIILCCPNCQTDEIMERIGLPMTFLFPDNGNGYEDSNDYVTAAVKYYQSKRKLHFVDAYHYDYGSFHDGLTKLRLKNPTDGKKIFSWIRRDGNAKNGLAFGRGECPNRLFVAGDINDSTVAVLEGEKDCLNFRETMGITAVCAENGADVKKSKWLDCYTNQLAGKEIYILNDNDFVGKAFAQIEYNALVPVAKSVYLVDLATVWNAPDKSDFSDLVESVGKGEAFELVNNLIQDVKTKPDGKEKPPEVFRLTALSEVTEKETDWLADKLIPRAAISVLGGDGGSGKSGIACLLAAAVSNGGRYVDLFHSFVGGGSKTVLFLSGEDDLERVLHKRLRLAGADMSNVYSLPLSDERFTQCKIGTDLLAGIISHYKPELLIVDPLQSFLQDNVAMERRNQMRNALSVLSGFAEKFSIAVLIVCHSNKGSENFGRRRLADSADLWDCARSVLLVGKTENDGEYYISHEKSNYSALQKTILYRLSDDESGQPVFNGFSSLKDVDFIKASRKNHGCSPQRLDCSELITTFLEENGGECEVNALDSYVLESGASKSALRKSKEDLKLDGTIKIYTKGFHPKRWYVVLVEKQNQH